MPDVWAIFVSDLHLQARPPVARSGEPDWFEAMARPLQEISDLACKHDADVLYAGDIFDRYNPSPEVINFALRYLPRGYAIPGQHDLPNHNYGDIKKSAYWSLVMADRIIDVRPGDPITLTTNRIRLHGFPWGYDPTPLTESDSGFLYVAMLHRYVWMKGAGYQGAPLDATVTAFSGKGCLSGYDVAVFGDNHKGFISRIKSGTVICNCGGMMRRKIDEHTMRPGVGLLYSDGSVKRHYFDTSEDVLAEAISGVDVVDDSLDMSAFVSDLENLSATDALDFEASLRRFFEGNTVPKGVRNVITQALE